MPRSCCGPSARRSSTSSRRSRIACMDGIGPVRAGRITAAWAEQKAVREIMVFLHSHGVGTARAVRIYKTHGADAVRVMSENPYRLARDIRGIGFRTEAMDEGHCGLPTDDLVPLAEKLLEVPHTTPGLCSHPSSCQPTSPGTPSARSAARLTSDSATACSVGIPNTAHSSTRPPSCAPSALGMAKARSRSGDLEPFLPRPHSRPRVRQPCGRFPERLLPRGRRFHPEFSPSNPSFMSEWAAASHSDRSAEFARSMAEERNSRLWDGVLYRLETARTEEEARAA